VRGTDPRLGRWFDLVAEVLRQPLAEVPYRDLNAELTATFDAYAAGLHTVDATGRHVLHVLPATLTMARLEELRPFGDMGPLARWYGATRSPSPQSSGFVPWAIADRRLVAEWRRVSQAFGVTEQLCIPLHTCGRERRDLIAARPDGDFGDDDLELAARLQPVLVGLERQAVELARWQQRRAPAAHVGGQVAVEESRLTGRELAVLNLLAEGLTAAAIARRLAISTRTVHKHLEHVYAKFGTGDRLTTVLRAQHAGLLP
jgi:DNA-binding CsgD family transcriptional regulator